MIIQLVQCVYQSVLVKCVFGVMCCFVHWVLSKGWYILNIVG